MSGELQNKQDTMDLSLIEKYDRFFQNDSPGDIDSDNETFPDDQTLREEYQKLRLETVKSINDKKPDLALALRNRFKRIDPNISVVDEDERSSPVVAQIKESENDLNPQDLLNHLIDDLDSVRSCEPDGNSIFCTKEEWIAIQEKYGNVLDFLYEFGSNNFEVVAEEGSESKLAHKANQDGDEDENEDARLLAKKMESVEISRNKFYDIKQQVKEQLDQLELIERYKMESVS